MKSNVSFESQSEKMITIPAADLVVHRRVLSVINLIIEETISFIVGYLVALLSCFGLRVGFERQGKVPHYSVPRLHTTSGYKP